MTRQGAADAGAILAGALRRREPLAGLGELTAYRLVHGAADGAPGLAVDRFAAVAIVHADAQAVLAAWQEVLGEQLGLPTGYV